MNTLIQKQYLLVKNIVNRIELESAYSAICSSMSYDRSIADLVKMMDLFALLTGNASLAGFIIIGSHNLYGKINELFAEYEKELLEADLIEFGDTISDDQKQHYYHQQQLEQQDWSENR